VQANERTLAGLLPACLFTFRLFADCRYCGYRLRQFYIQMSLKDPLLSVSLFCHLASIILCALILSETLALYKSLLIYLLTTTVYTFL